MHICCWRQWLQPRMKWRLWLSCICNCVDWRGALLHQRNRKYSWSIRCRCKEIWPHRWTQSYEDLCSVLPFCTAWRNHSVQCDRFKMVLIWPITRWTRNLLHFTIQRWLASLKVGKNAHRTETKTCKWCCSNEEIGVWRQKEPCGRSLKAKRTTLWQETML